MSSKDTSPTTLESLQTKLDALWENHLHLLDQYDTAQKQVQKSFSDGFFSLAQATFKSPMKMRYGRDYYDERMQASRRVGVFVDGGDERLRISVGEEKDAGKDGKTVEEEDGKGKKGDGVEKEEEEEEVVEQLPTPPATPLHHAEDNSEPEEENAEPLDEKAAHGHTKQDEKHAADEKDKAGTSEQPDEPKAKKPRDPVNWYGILVPSQLRQSQASFVQAVEGPIGEAVTAAQGMKRIEVEIRRLRKDIKKAEKKGLVVDEK